MSLLRVVVVVALFMYAAVGAAPVTGDHTEGFHIELDEDHTLDVPERTIDTEHGEYTISTLGQYTEDETVSVETEAPPNVSYSIRLIDSQERLRESEYRSGDAEATFGLDRYGPGTYAVAMMNGTEEVYALELLVISGYTITDRTPDKVKTDESLSVAVTLEKIDSEVDEPPHNVALAFGNDSTTIRTDATRTEDLNYTAEIDVDSFSPGTYELYVGVERDNTVYGHNELIGVDTYEAEVVEAAQKTNTATSTQTATQTDSAGRAAPGGGSTTEAGDVTTTPKSNSTATTAPTPDTLTPTTPTTETLDLGPSSATEDPSVQSNGTATDGATDTATPPPDEPGTTVGTTPTSTPLLSDGAVLLLAVVAVLATRRVR